MCHLLADKASRVIAVRGPLVLELSFDSLTDLQIQDNALII